VLLEVDTFSVEVPEAPLTGTAAGLNEHVGAGVPAPVTLHARVTLPV
jgi:hypothetical protein